MSRIIALIAVAALIALATSVLSNSPAWAKKPIIVTTLDDEDDVDPGSGCSLREAIDSAQSGLAVGGCAAGKGGTVRITFDIDPAELPGTIMLNATLPNIVPGVHVNIVGPGAANLTIDRAGGPRHLLVASGGNLSLSGVRLAGSADGSAIQVVTGRLTLSECVIDHNIGLFGGGGALDLVDSLLTINRCTFFDNDTFFDSGGAIRIADGTTSIRNSAFINNFADSTGGAIALLCFIPPGCTLAIDRSIFAGNEASSGVAVGALVFGSVTVSTSITSSTFVSNTLKFFLADRAIILNSASGPGAVAVMNVTDSTVAGNAFPANSFDILSEATASGTAVLTVTNTVFDDCAGAGTSECP